jgi:hypothetical protein
MFNIFVNMFFLVSIAKKVITINKRFILKYIYYYPDFFYTNTLFFVVFIYFYLIYLFFIKMFSLNVFVIKNKLEHLDSIRRVFNNNQIILRDNLCINSIIQKNNKKY